MRTGECQKKDLPEQEESEGEEDEDDEMQPPELDEVLLHLGHLAGLADGETVLRLGDLVLGAAHDVDCWSC